MDKIRASDILQHKKIEGKAIMYLIQQMAKYAHTTGRVLDCEDMIIDECYLHSNSISEEIMDYTRHLQEIGYLTFKDDLGACQNIYPAMLDVDGSILTKSNIWFKKGDNRIWTHQWSLIQYPKYMNNFRQYEEIEFLMIMIVAKGLIDSYDKKIRGNIIIDFEDLANSIIMYVSILKIEKCLRKWLKRSPISLIWETEKDYDVGYKIFYDECIEMQKAGGHTIVDKERFIHEEGIQKGAILALYTRNHLTQYRPWGDIVNVNIVKYKGIEHDCVLVDKICITKTKEEKMEEWKAMSSDKQGMYIDILNDATVLEATIPLYNLGIDHYMTCTASEGEFEPNLLMKIDTSTETSLYTEMNGKVDNYSMKEVDAVYWLLKQNHIKFDEGLYKEMYYRDGVVPLWEVDKNGE